MTLRAILRRLLGEPTPDAAALSRPTAQMGEAFNRMLEDLRGSTERLEDLVFKLSTLNEVVELAARVPDLNDLLSLVLERTMRTVRAGIGSIMLLDHERKVLRVVAARGLPEDVIGQAEVRVGEGIAGKVVLLGEPVLVEDITTDPRFAKPSEPKYGSGAFMCLPVRVEETDGQRGQQLLLQARRVHGHDRVTHFLHLHRRAAACHTVGANLRNAERDALRGRSDQAGLDRHQRVEAAGTEMRRIAHHGDADARGLGLGDGEIHGAPGVGVAKAALAIDQRRHRCFP